MTPQDAHDLRHAAHRLRSIANAIELGGLLDPAESKMLARNIDLMVADLLRRRADELEGIA